MTNFAELRLRAATMEDADLLLEWANDPAVRAASFSSEPIDRDTHVAWLEAKLEAGRTGFYICERDSVPVGYARVDLVEDGVGELALSVDARERGRGLGTKLIRLAAERAVPELELTEIVAHVKPGNEASVRAFLAAGFTQVESSDRIRLRWRPQEIPHSRPRLSAAAVAAAVSVLQSGRIADGEVARELESRWCEETGMTAAAAVGSGLAALRLALLALGVGPGDEVIVPAYSCVALLNAPLSLGAEPVLADVVLDDWTLDVEDVARLVTGRTRAIVAVDLFGMPARLAELNALGPPVVEDCAHGIGGTTSAGPFGGGSVASISSFYATKMIGAGEGGIVAVRDDALIERVREARDYGDRSPDGRNLNDKLTDVEAALALEQLERLPETLAERERLARRYDELLAPNAAVLPASSAGRIWYRYAVRLESGEARQVCEAMAAGSVRAEQPVWDLRGCEQWRNDLAVTAEAFDRVVSLPLYPGLRADEQERVVEAFARAVG